MTGQGQVRGFCIKFIISFKLGNSIENGWDHNSEFTTPGQVQCQSDVCSVQCCLLLHFYSAPQLGCWFTVPIVFYLIFTSFKQRTLNLQGSLIIHRLCMLQIIFYKNCLNLAQKVNDGLGITLALMRLLNEVYVISFIIKSRQHVNIECFEQTNRMQIKGI